jgi:ribA/ribD-fused uncharacterized protein
MFDFRAELATLQALDPPPPLLFFWGHRGASGPSCLSQWFSSPFVVDGHSYPTAEHFMMAEKARVFQDEDAERRILAAATPAQAKALGRAVRKYDAQVWDRCSPAVVVRGNIAKFQQNAPLCAYLLSTGDHILVEASPEDSIWGIGLTREHADAAHPARWPGQNRLGFALMEVRRYLRSSAQPCA